jgi:hypothetical protein
MSWMIKGGSSSALGQSPLHFPLNELARCGVASPKHGAKSATCSDYVDDSRWGSRAASATREANTSWAVNVGGELPAGKGVYPSEGFG